MTKRLLFAGAIGVVATFAFIGLAFVSDDMGYASIAQVLMWPNSILQSFAPAHNIGTTEHVVLEGSPLNDVAFYASIPIGFLVYGLMAYTVLRMRNHGS